jgi:WD40 repeat protein
VLLSTDDFEPVGTTMTGHRSRVTALEFSPDGRRLLTGSPDGVVQLWDVATQTAIGEPLPVAPGALVTAAFTADGSSVVAVPDRGTGVRWDVRESTWQRMACSVAGRPMSDALWRQELPGRAYREVCASP